MGGKWVTDERLATVVAPSGVIFEVWGLPPDPDRNPLGGARGLKLLMEAVSSGKPFVLSNAFRVKVLAGGTSDAPHVAGEGNG